MFDYDKYFTQYRDKNKLDIELSFNMPEGYETANGTFDIESKTVFINAELLKDVPDYEKAFYLFHELRHSSQYLCPEQFSDAVIRSLQYVIMYNGTCFKKINCNYYECKLKGDEENFTKLYAGQPYEADANTYAYEQVKKIFGDSEGLRKLYEFWMPDQPVPDEVYNSVYSLIDEKIQVDDSVTNSGLSS